MDATPPQGRKVGTEFTPGHSMNVVERTTPPQGIDRDADADAAWRQCRACRAAASVRYARKAA